MNDALRPAVLRPLARLPWPLPALLAWALGWSLFLALREHGLGLALLCGAAAAAALAWLWPVGAWRKGLMAGGFVLSLLASGMASGIAALAWLLPLASCALVYPLQAWRDAPMFPTPANALTGLAQAAMLTPNVRVLDIGCGMGHGLLALRRACPSACIEGIERSWPLWLVARMRCRWARVVQGDMWRHDWSAYGLVYLFQRPESMDGAMAKAEAEMAPGSWLVSLEFAVPGRAADGQLGTPAGRPVWLYRMGRSIPSIEPQPGAQQADKPGTPLAHPG